MSSRSKTSLADEIRVAEEERLRSKTLMSDLEQVRWAPARRRCFRLVNSARFDTVMAMSILGNLGLMMVEADERAVCYPEECRLEIITWFNRFLLVLYTCESAIRFFVHRERFYHDHWNVFDLIIVSIGWLDEVVRLVFSSLPMSEIVPILRVLRLARLIRAVRLLKFYPELYVMVRGFIGAMRAMFWGFVMIVLLLLLWSLICVEIVNPVNRNMVEEIRAAGRGAEVNRYCEDAFSSVFKACLLLFQTLVAGDSWGQCTIPVIKYQPLTLVFFAVALVSVSLGFMNLILAVIVDRAAAARDSDKEDQAKEHMKKEAQSLQQWKDIIKQVDTDGSGSISLDELLEGYKQPDVHDTLNLMGITQSDLVTMFTLMDEDGSGELDYDEFLDSFLKAQGQDLRIYLMMTKLQCDNIAKSVRRLDGEMKKDPMSMSRGPSRRPTGAAEDAASRGASRRSISPTGANEVWARTLSGRSAEEATGPALGDRGGPPGGAAALFDGDFQAMNARLQANFEALHRMLELNMKALTSQARALEGAVAGDLEKLAQGAADVLAGTPDKLAGAEPPAASGQHPAREGQHPAPQNPAPPNPAPLTHKMLPEATQGDDPARDRAPSVDSDPQGSVCGI